MAEAVGLAASILALATTGAKLASALTKFSISYRGAEQKISEIASRASLTSNILQEIASTLQSHEDIFQKSAFLSTWCDVLGSASGCFERLEAALEKARGPGSKRDRGAWSTLKKWEWALGGEERMAECERGLEKCGQQVLMMQQVIQYKVLQKIVPTERERDEKRELREKLDWIVRRLEETGLVSVPPPTRQTSKGLSPKISSPEGSSSKLMSARILPPTVPLPKGSGVQRQSSTMQSSESFLNLSTDGEPISGASLNPYDPVNIFPYAPLSTASSRLGGLENSYAYDGPHVARQLPPSTPDPPSSQTPFRSFVAIPPPGTSHELSAALPNAQILQNPSTLSALGLARCQAHQVFEAYYFIPDILLDERMENSLQVTNPSSSRYIPITIDISWNLTSRRLLNRAISSLTSTPPQGTSAMFPANKSVNQSYIERKMDSVPDGALKAMECIAELRCQTSSSVYEIADIEALTFDTESPLFKPYKRGRQKLYAFMVLYRAVVMREEKPRAQYLGRETREYQSASPRLARGPRYHSRSPDTQPQLAMQPKFIDRNKERSSPSRYQPLPPKAHDYRPVPPQSESPDSDLENSIESSEWRGSPKGSPSNQQYAHSSRPGSIPESVSSEPTLQMPDLPISLLHLSEGKDQLEHRSPLDEQRVKELKEKRKRLEELKRMRHARLENLRVSPSKGGILESNISSLVAERKDTGLVYDIDAEDLRDTSVPNATKSSPAKYVIGEFIGSAKAGHVVHSGSETDEEEPDSEGMVTIKEEVKERKIEAAEKILEDFLATFSV